MTRPDADTPPLIVVGASVRAVAASAARAGWSVHAADLYADADLRATATTTTRVRVDSALPWPAGLESAITGFPVAPWLYTGALENHPDLVDRLARVRPLAGNDGDRLRAVRDPARLAAAVRAAGLMFPDTFADPTGLPVDGAFLVKPRASAGGRGVARWLGGCAPADRVWQRFVPGRPWSVAFAMHDGVARTFAASRQLVGRRWCGTGGHAWCGAIDIAVATLPSGLRARLDRLGAALADHFGLVGIVGVDLVRDASGGLHVIEVNPRPTASLELAERATGESVVATHLAACGFAAPRACGSPPPRRRRVWAKAVVFADRTTPFDVPLAGALAALADRWADDDGWPPLADLAEPDTTIAAGGPALTVFAAADTATAALRAVRGRVSGVRAALRGAGVSPPADGARRPPPPGSTA